MRNFLKSNRLKAIFTVLSIVLVIGYAVLYITEVRDALGMDLDSYNCTSDSMMKQVCEDPYGSAITWAFLGLIWLGWPAIILWIAVGIALLISQKQRKGSGSAALSSKDT